MFVSRKRNLIINNYYVKPESNVSMFFWIHLGVLIYEIDCRTLKKTFKLEIILEIILYWYVKLKEIFSVTSSLV